VPYRFSSKSFLVTFVLALIFLSASAGVASAEDVSAEIPALVKHLPRWEEAQKRAAYVRDLPALQAAAGNRPVLDAIALDGGEAVTAIYDSATRLVIVEYFTPQLASDNDKRVTERINGLRNGGQPAPSLYRRVGNYLVFVFDAPNAEAAERLAGEVKYEQEVRWLGEYPYAVEDAQRANAGMAADVIIATLQASGLTLLVSLGLGGLLGAFVFMRRRAQATKVFTDAGGMVRLNIDEVTPQHDPQRLLKQGESGVGR